MRALVDGENLCKATENLNNNTREISFVEDAKDLSRINFGQYPCMLSRVSVFIFDNQSISNARHAKLNGCIMQPFGRVSLMAIKIGIRKIVNSR